MGMVTMVMTIKTIMVFPPQQQPCQLRIVCDHAQSYPLVIYARHGEKISYLKISDTSCIERT